MVYWKWLRVYVWCPTSQGEINMKAIFAVINNTWAVVKIRPEKVEELHGIWTHDLCDTKAELYQLS